MSVSLSDVLHGQVILGLVVSLANIAAHSVMMAGLHSAVRRARGMIAWANHSVQIAVVMMASVSVLMAAHIFEVTIWGLTYLWTGAVAVGQDAFYFAFVNYTTLGYGDVLPAQHWRVLGPVAAMNGILLFGWSTAVIYDTLRAMQDGVARPAGTNGVTPP